MTQGQQIASLYAKVGADTKDAEGGLSRVKGMLGSVGGGFADMGKFAAIGMAGVGAAIAGVIGYAGNAAAGFEQTLSSIKAVSGASATEMGQISKLALQLGKDTVFSAKEAGQGIEELIKGGVSLPDVMNGAAFSMLNLASAGGVALPDAAEIAANAMAMFGLKGADMAHVADLIAGAANASSLSVMDFKFSLAESGAMAKLSGQTFDDLATAIAIMGKAGIKGSNAGTSLKTMMANLIPSTKNETAALTKLGIITADGTNKFIKANGQFKGMAEISEVLYDATKDLTEAERQQYLGMAFGTDAIRAAALLSQSGAAGFREMADAMGKVTAASVAATKLDNLKGSIEQLKGSLETAGISLGVAFLPMLRGGVDALTGFANAAIPWIEDVGPRVVDMVGRVGSKLSDLGGALGDILSGKLDIGDALGQAFVVALGKLGPIIGAFDWAATDKAIMDGLFGALGAGRNLSVRLAGWLGEQFAKIDWSYTWSQAQGLGAGLLATRLTIVSDVERWLQVQWAGIGWDAIWEQATGIGSGLAQQIRSTDWTAVGTALGGALASILPAAVELGLQAKDLGSKIVTGVTNLLGSINWGEIGKTALPMLAGFAIGMIAALMDPVVWWQVFSQNWGDIIMIIAGIVATPTGFLGPIIGAISKIPLAGKILAWMVSEISILGKGFLAAVGGVLGTMGEEFMMGFLKVLEGKAGPGLLSRLRGVIQAAADGIIDFGETFYIRALYFMENMGRAIAEHGPLQVVQAFRNLFNAVDQFLVERIPNIVARGAEWAGGLIRGIVNAMRGFAIPVPNFSIGWEEISVLGQSISKPKIDIGVVWRALADFIPGLAAGGTATRGGMAMVGERGPELLNLPSGAQVTPLGMGAGGYGGGIDYDRLANAMVSALGRAGLRVDMDGAQVARLLYPHTQQLVRL